MDLDLSVVIATRNRPAPLRKTLRSLSRQSLQPKEIIVIDASDNELTKEVCLEELGSLAGQLRWFVSAETGAAKQRNEGVRRCRNALIGFFDDDIELEPECLSRLCAALQQDPALGGVNAMITNQQYQAPGFVSRVMFTLLHGRREKSFAGKIVGPALNLLPEDRHDLPEVVPVEWLNTTCTIYRRAALPSPPFDSFFTGYSLMEDVALSITVAQPGWKLANVRTARIFHDSQPGAHKSDLAELSSMELNNRHYLMTEVLGRRGFINYLKLLLFELFQFTSVARQRPRALWGMVLGKTKGIAAIRKRTRAKVIRA
jgi:GT2 family glycosyltransferase